MHDQFADVFDALYRSGHRAQLVIAGSRAEVIARMFAAGAQSRAALDRVALTSPGSLAEWLGRAPVSFTGDRISTTMAVLAYWHAQHAGPRNGGRPIGLACLLPDVIRDGKNSNRPSCVAMQTHSHTHLYRIIPENPDFDSDVFERELAHFVLQTLAWESDRHRATPFSLEDGLSLEHDAAHADSLLADVWSGRSKCAWSMRDGSFQPQVVRPRGIVCGAFDPLHRGHVKLRSAAARVLGGPVYYELSLVNADKLPLDYLTIQHRRNQFRDYPVALTHAATFAEKAEIFPGHTFVVGVDTADRVLQPRFYGGSTARMVQVLNGVRDGGCRFLVAGRLCGNAFRTMSQIGMPPGLESLFQELPEAAFRVDISSTDLRDPFTAQGA